MSLFNGYDVEEDDAPKTSPIAERARAAAARGRAAAAEKGRVRRERATLILQFLILAALVFIALELHWLRKEIPRGGSAIHSPFRSPDREPTY